MDFRFVQALGAAVPDPGSVLAVFLLALRISAIFLLTPILHAFAMPATVRVVLVIGLAFALALGLPTELTRELAAMDLGRLVSAAATEFGLGATLALGILTAFGAITFAGRLLDVQVGFGMGQVFDPVTQRQVPVLTSAFDKLGVVMFFLVNGHHALLRGVAYSLERFPIGGAWSMEAAAPWVIKHAAGLFALGVALAAPAMVCLLMVELALGVVARNLPQMNMFVLEVPIKVVVGLAALAFWLSGIGDAMSRIYGSIYSTWDNVFASAPAAARGGR